MDHPDLVELNDPCFFVYHNVNDLDPTTEIKPVSSGNGGQPVNQVQDLGSLFLCCRVFRVPGVAGAENASLELQNSVARALYSPRCLELGDVDVDSLQCRSPEMKSAKSASGDHSVVGFCAHSFKMSMTVVFGRQTIDVTAPETEIAGGFRSEVVAHWIILSNTYWRGQCGRGASVYRRYGGSWDQRIPEECLPVVGRMRNKIKVKIVDSE
jgi:hypothetical protein